MNLKINKDNLEESNNRAADARLSIFNAYQKLESFEALAVEYSNTWQPSLYYQEWKLNRTGVDPADYTRWDIDDKKYKVNHDAFNTAAQTAAENIIKSKRESFQAECKDMHSLYKDSWLHMIDVTRALVTVTNLLNEYERTQPETIEEYFTKSIERVSEKSDVVLEGLSLATDDLEGIISGVQVEIDGKTYTLEEAANAVLTEAGACAASVYAAGLQLMNDKDFQKLTPQQQAAVFNRVAQDVADQSQAAGKVKLDTGYYGLSSEEEVKDFYERYTGVKWDAERVHNEAETIKELTGTKNDELFDKFGVMVGGAATLSGVMNFGLTSDEDLEKNGLGYLAEGRKNVTEGTNVDENGEVDEDKLVDPDGNPEESPTKPDGSKNPPGSETGDGPTSSDGGELDPESDPTPEPGDENPDELEPPADPDVKDPEENIIPDNRTHNITEDPIPEPPGLDNKMDNKTIDKLAEERFYEQYTPEQLADYRGKQVDEFNNLFSNKDKSELVDFYNGAGYNLNEAKLLADNKELGLAAFLAAKQSADMAELSRSIAQSANMDMTMFDTRFDNGASYKDLVSGDTNAFLANPNNNPKVSSAKQSMNNAKTQYDKAVDTANKSIDEAKENKDKLDSVRKNIVKKSGNDSSNWSDDDIEKYNDAVNEYNGSVKQANEDVSAAQNAKTEYDNSKAEYESRKDEFYEQIKEETLKNREISESGDLPDDVPESNVPERNGNGSSGSGGQSYSGNSGNGSSGNGGQGSSGNNELIPDVPGGNDSSGNNEIIPDLPDGNSNNPGVEGSGMGFGKPDNGVGNNGNSEGLGFNQNNSSNPTIDTSNESYVGVDDSNSGLGFRNNNESSLTETNSSQNNDNSEYIYVDDSVNPVIDDNDGNSEPRTSSNGIGF